MSGLFTGNPYAEVGRFTAGTESSTGGTGGAAGGGITAGVMDGTYLSSQLGDVETTFIGSYTAPSTTTGRFTLSGIGSQNFVAYIIDANRMFMLSTNSSNELLAGDMRTQQQSANTASALLSGSYVFYGHAFEGNSTGSVTGYDSFVYQVSGTGTGTSTINASFDDDDGTFTAGKENGPGGAPTFDSSNPGRATAACGNDSCFFYFFNAGSAFFLDLNGSNYYLETGWLEAQTQPSSPPFANANVAGSYLSGELPRESSGANDNIGEITLNSSGGMTGSNTLASAGSLQWDQPSSAMGATGYSWLSTTYGSLSGTIDSTAFESCIDVTPVKSGATGKIVCIENTSQGANVDILEQ
jgi:hypothetical protein